jgi:hypothetical protein
MLTCVTRSNPTTEACNTFISKKLQEIRPKGYPIYPFSDMPIQLVFEG